MFQFVVIISILLQVALADQYNCKVNRSVLYADQLASRKICSDCVFDVVLTLINYNDCITILDSSPRLNICVGSSMDVGKIDNLFTIPQSEKIYILFVAEKEYLKLIYYSTSIGVSAQRYVNLRE